MCYSRKCRWEGFMGDCNFPNIKAVREKYPHPVCEIGDDNKKDFLATQEAINNIINIVNESLRSAKQINA